MCDINSFIKFYMPLQGQTFTTVGGYTKFQLLSVQTNKLVYKVSTGKTRDHTRKRIGMVLDHYKKTKSLRPKDYQDISVNASYILRLIECYAHSKGQAK